MYLITERVHSFRLVAFLCPVGKLEKDMGCLDARLRARMACCPGRMTGQHCFITGQGSSSPVLICFRTCGALSEVQ